MSNAAQADSEEIKRIPACDECRHHKIKCIDKDKPPCKRCRAFGISCTFGAKSRMVPSARTSVDHGADVSDPSRLSSLENQMRDVHSALRDITSLLRAPGAVAMGNQRIGPDSFHQQMSAPRSLDIPDRDSMVHFESSSSISNLDRRAQSGLRDSRPDISISPEGSTSQRHSSVKPSLSQERGPSIGFSPLDPPSRAEDFLAAAATTAPMSEVLYEDEQARLREDTLPDEQRGSSSDTSQAQPNEKSHLRGRKRKFARDPHEDEQDPFGPGGAFSDDPDAWSKDPIDQGLCTLEEGTLWFQRFFNGAHNYLPLFDPQHDTFERLRKRSPLAVSVILMVGQKTSEPTEDSKAVQMRLKSAADRLASITLFSPVCSIELVSATLILSCWSDTAWRLGMQALAIAVDLGIHRCLPRLVETGMGSGKTQEELERERPLVAGARVFMGICKTIIEMCFNYGRPIPFPFEWTMKSARKLLNHPLSLVFDSRLVMVNEVYAMRIPLHEPWTLKPTSKSMNDSSIVEAKTRLQEWATYWRAYYELQEVMPDHFLVTELFTIECYAVLQINAAVLYGVRDKEDVLALTVERRSWLEAALQAASTLVARVARRSEFEKLKYANRFAHLGLVTVARYLIRLACLMPEEIDLRRAAKDVELMAEKLATISDFRLAGFLRSIVNKAREQSQLPPGSRIGTPSRDMSLHMTRESEGDHSRGNALDSSGDPGAMYYANQEGIPSLDGLNWAFLQADDLFSSQSWMETSEQSLDPNVWSHSLPLGPEFATGSLQDTSMPGNGYWGGADTPFWEK